MVETALVVMALHDKVVIAGSSVVDPLVVAHKVVAHKVVADP